MVGRITVDKIMVPAATGVCFFVLIRLFCLLPIQSITGPACEALKSLIDSIPFAHSTTSSLIKALLTGDRSELGRDIISTFRDSGASHLLALSGLHLGFIYSILSRLVSIIGNTPSAKTFRACLIIAFSTFYTLMTGTSPSTVRALIFITINELCRLNPERRHNMFRIIPSSLLIQLAITPSVIGTVGFQLSYAAICGLFLIGTPLQRWYPSGSKLNVLKKVWDSAAISIGCQVFTAPLAWYYFHSFPSHFILTNLMALPLTSSIMALAVICLTLSAAEICPDFLVKACDFSVQSLLRVLETIGMM